MSTVVEQNARQTAQALNTLVSSVAANDDHLPGQNAKRDAAATGGWNAHDVWRKLIKEARDRRATGEAQ